VPIDRAVPATAAWRLEVVGVEVGHLRSGDLGELGSVICRRPPAGVVGPCRARGLAQQHGVGGVLRIERERPVLETVISTGTIVPRWFSVAAL
jgi:hypothetical protein